MTPILDRSAEIVQAAITTIQPKATVALVSGGDDSLTAFYVAQRLNIKLDYIVHVYTGTGIVQTRQFVERWAATTGVPLLVSDAGDAYEKYIRRKGFFGRGERAHTMSYHILKASALRKAISRIRQRRRNFKVMMLTGIRLDESDNRKYNFANQTVKRDGKLHNYFVNIIEHFSQQDCRALLNEVGAPRNPVTKALHRSGECMCGTMQTKEDRELASILFPEWGKWIDHLESEVVAKHGWGWGEEMPKEIKQRRAGQLPFLIDGFEMCRHCLLNEVTP